MIDEIIQKLSDEIPRLKERVQGAVDFGKLVAGGQMPSSTFSAFVLPSGLSGRGVYSTTGAFTQEFEEAASVVLAIRSFDASGKQALDPLRELIMEVFRSLGGWAPAEDAPDVLRLLNGRLLSMQAGLLVYQLDFALTDQMRIAR